MANLNPILVIPWPSSFTLLLPFLYVERSNFGQILVGWSPDIKPIALIELTVYFIIQHCKRTEGESKKNPLSPFTADFISLSCGWPCKSHKKEESSSWDNRKWKFYWIELAAKEVTMEMPTNGSFIVAIAINKKWSSATLLTWSELGDNLYWEVFIYLFPQFIVGELNEFDPFDILFLVAICVGLNFGLGF